MLAKLRTRIAVLDFTDVAIPLTFDEIHADINQVLVEYSVNPEKIVLWQHQWDWLTKSIPTTLREVQVFQESTPLAPRPSTIWGVPIEIREPAV